MLNSFSHACIGQARHACLFYKWIIRSLWFRMTAPYDRKSTHTDFFVSLDPFFFYNCNNEPREKSGRLEKSPNVESPNARWNRLVPEEGLWSKQWHCYSTGPSGSRKVCPWLDQLASNRYKVCRVPQRASYLPLRDQLGQDQDGMTLQKGDVRSPRQN